MSQPLQLPPLYGVLDPEQTKGRSPELALGALLDGGIKALQLRAKNMTGRDFLALAEKAREATRVAGCSLIVNDRVDIALACGADGVHLGQEDLPLAPARRLMREKIVGISTHDLEQARAAERDGADYIGFGPIFGTRTKETGYTVRGVALLRQIRESVRIPIVAIGGINETNVTDVWNQGLVSAAIISDLLQSDDIAAKVRRILASYTAESGRSE
jgi:thiamine-phosphate pyrophosphorylase